MPRTVTALTSIEPDLASLVLRIRSFAGRADRRARALDADGAFPADDIAELAAAGALLAPFPPAFGGSGLGTDPQTARIGARVLALVGWGSLAVGRLFEGHVNAIKLVVDFGTPEQLARLAADAGRGHLFGVWNTQAPDNGVLLGRGPQGMALTGAKTFASGAGFVDRPLLTARTEDGRELMVMPRLLRPEGRADLSGWQAHGMRASATGTFDVSGLTIEPSDIIGGDGDYHREPNFSAGAWRFLAVQLGGCERLLDALRDHLRATGRGSDPYQLHRVGQTTIAVETARLWIEAAADVAFTADAETAVAYVGLARLAVERAGLDTIEHVQRSIGLQGFLRTHPVERVCRDLATYLRQPAPDRALAAAASHVLDVPTPGSMLWRGGGEDAAR